MIPGRIAKMITNPDSHEEQIKQIIASSAVESYTKGWQGAEKHFKDSIIKGIVND